MPLTGGTRLGPYEIVALIGAGGMGEVYRAKDTKLDREVAIKVLPAALAQDAERLARFEREAKVLASLNHPNIAQIYGVEERALVMELVEGQTLQGPLPLDTALNYARQIADALEAAHEKNIIHRDLKPANIMITPAGVVKVLDFGLAAVTQSSDPSNPANSPTLTISPTRAGMILGTAAYMSPEQARGTAVDKRADIWAFGVVFHEMLTGKRLFEGETVSDTLAHVLTKQPDWEQVPAKVRRLLEACLQKDPKQRLQAIGDWRLLLTDVQQLQVAAPSRSRLGWIVATVVLAALVVIAGIGWWRATRPVAYPLVRISTELAPVPGNAYGYQLDDTIVGTGQPGTFLAISPDGTRLALQVFDPTARQFLLAIRRLDESRFTPLAGTEDPASPFFSPDGQWIAFLGDGKLRKIPVQGGAPVVLCSAENFASGAWGDDGNIIAALKTNGGLSRISPAGGTPAAVTELAEGETMHRWPQVLPGSDAVLFTAYTGGGAEDANIDALSFKTHQRKTLVRGGEMARYVTGQNGEGYLIYLHQSALLAVAFDPRKLATAGTAQPILEDVRAIGQTYRGDFDISRTGTLVYLSGSGEPERWIFWLDRTGKTEPLHSAPGLYNGLQFSPDGKHLVFGMGDVLVNEELWVQDLERNTSVRLTFLGGVSTSPLWSPDGKYILFAHQPNGGFYRVRADGAGVPQQLVKSETPTFPSSISPDAKRVAFAAGNPFTAMEVSTAPLEGTADHPLLGKMEPFLRASGFPMPAFSPDGRWLAYSSAETGTEEIYVQPYPGPGSKVAISTGGGGFPVWSPKAHQLFFTGSGRRIMVTDYSAAGDSFTPGKPRLWSPHPILLNYGGGPFQPYALAADGKRFAVMLYPDGTTERHSLLHLTFLLNFADELRRRVPAGK
jgi:Tol biopolymer transport system component/predicted Ser/Thr protein kinase